MYAGVQLDKVQEEYRRETQILKGWIGDKQVRLEQLCDEVERLVMLELQKAASGSTNGAGESRILDDSLMQ